MWCIVLSFSHRREIYHKTSTITLNVPSSTPPVHLNSFRRFLQKNRRRVKLCVEYLYHRHSFIQWHTIAPACLQLCLLVYSRFLTMKLSQLMLFCSSSSFSNDSFIINASLVGAWLARMDSCRRRILSREGVRKQGSILHLILPFSPIICLFVHHLLSCIPFH